MLSERERLNTANIALPEGMAQEHIDAINNSYIIQESKKRVGNIFLSVASEQRTPEEKISLFRLKASGDMLKIKGQLEKAIPEKNIDAAISYILSQSIVETIQSHISHHTISKGCLSKTDLYYDIDGLNTLMKSTNNIVRDNKGLAKLFEAFEPLDNGINR